MGTCYSCQARISKPTYPSDMSLSSNSSTKKGLNRGPGSEAYSHVKSSRLRPPSVKLTNSRAGSNSSIDHLNTSNESGIVLTADSTKSKKKSAQNGNQRKSEGHTGLPKFGFGQRSPRSTRSQRSDANRNLMDVSSDSLDSIDSRKSSSSSTKPARRNLNDNVGRAFDPKIGKGWRMIDDSESTTTDSKSVSTRGKSEHEAERDPNGNALLSNPPLRLRGSETHSLNGNSLKKTNSSSSKLTSRLKPPGSKKAPDRQWVKAGQVDMEGKKNSEDKPSRAPVDTNAPQKRRLFFSRGRGKLQFGSDRGGDKIKTDQSVEKVENESIVEDEISRTVQTMLDSSPDSKDVKDKINVLSKDMSKLTVSGGDADNDEGKLLNDIEDSDHEDCPLARLDSLDTCSLSSLNSDDMMLETDLLEDTYNQSTASMEASFGAGSLPRQRAQNRDVLSLSQPATGLAKLDKRPFTRRNTPDGSWRQNSLKGSDGTRERRARTQSATSEAVAELSGMMVTGASGPPSIQRRPPKFSRERPASFPGPLSADGKPPGGDRAIQLRQRGRAPSIGDEEQVLVDANTFRFMMQELTDCKTMIFKLKRVIQEEEIGSPFGNTTIAGSLKNGYKLGSGGSTPQSPLVGSDGTFAFIESGESKKFQDVMQENSELQEQVASMQQKMEEQERTIKLLQQQMTKYECGHIGPEGKVYSSSTTQTEKPRMTVPKSVLRPSAGGQPSSAGGASAGGEAAISSRRIPESRDVNEPAGAGASGEKHTSTAKSQLPTSGGVLRGQRSSGSRLPSMRIQRVNKGQTKLQSFTKIAPPQQVNY